MLDSLDFARVIHPLPDALKSEIEIGLHPH